MFRLLILNTLGLGSNTPVQQRNVDQDDLLVYTLKGSPRRLVREYLQQKLGKGDVWVVNDSGSFAVIELTFSGYRITGTHKDKRFSSKKVELIIQEMNDYCSASSAA